jgi:hypothetical protein
MFLVPRLVRLPGSMSVCTEHCLMRNVVGVFRGRYRIFASPQAMSVTGCSRSKRRYPPTGCSELHLSRSAAQPSKSWSVITSFQLQYNSDMRNGNSIAINHLVSLHLHVSIRRPNDRPFVLSHGQCNSSLTEGNINIVVYLFVTEEA